MKEHDRKGQEPFLVDKTRLAIRDLRNRIKVSIQSVESISRRIEILRDEELQPQLMELIQGYGFGFKFLIHLIIYRDS